MISDILFILFLVLQNMSPHGNSQEHSGREIINNESQVYYIFIPVLILNGICGGLNSKLEIRQFRGNSDS